LNCELKDHDLSDVKNFYKKGNIYTLTQQMQTHAHFSAFLKSILVKEIKIESPEVVQPKVITENKNQDWVINEKGNYIHTEYKKLVKIIWSIRIEDNRFYLSNHLCNFELGFDSLAVAQDKSHRDYIITIMVDKKIIRI
jgi:hypothetical protein